MQVDISSPLLKWPVYNFWERCDEAGRGSTSDQRSADWRPEVQDHEDQDFSHMGHEGAAQAEEPSLVCVYASLSDRFLQGFIRMYTHEGIRFMSLQAGSHQHECLARNVCPIYLNTNAEQSSFIL